ncbi:molecular chaperone [Thalassotalea aquiviva]|uniref:TorD/DmsD family molecular chaperone n=1 Tax=Thalassotalea aquiviva TaxID=3242415 RepID=UPI00352BB65C
MNVKQQTTSNEPYFRQDVYQLLAALYQQPPAQNLLEFIQQLQVRFDHGDNQPLLSALAALQQQALGDNVELLEQQFFTLFIGLSEGEVSPYASWYLDGHLMSDSLVKLREHLRVLAIVRDKHNKEPEDHITAILQVMAILMDTEGEDQQLAFFEQHLQPWYQIFCKQLINNQASPFYQKVGQLTFIFLQQEQTRLAQRHVKLEAR